MPVVAIGAVVATCTYIATHDPRDPSSAMSTCPTKALIGLDCPVCGALRMVHALSRGDLVAAANDNLLVLACLPLLTLGAIVWLRSAWTGARWKAPRWLPSPLVIPGVAIGWMVVRNIPAFPLHPLG